MTEPAPTLPQEIAEAFCDAVFKFRQLWSPAHPDQPLVSVRAVCDLAGNYDERLPDAPFQDLVDQMHAEHSAIKEALGRDQTYATADQCLMQMLRRQRRCVSAAPRMSAGANEPPSPVCG